MHKKCSPDSCAKDILSHSAVEYNMIESLSEVMNMQTLLHTIARLEAISRHMYPQTGVTDKDEAGERYAGPE